MVQGVVVAGHDVASGRKRDPRFPDGTLALQLGDAVRNCVAEDQAAFIR